MQTINGFGQTTVESEGVSVTIDRPGYGSTVVPGEPPSPPVLIDAAAMEAAFNSLESSGEASGGSEDPPDDSDVAESGIGEGGSENDPSEIAPSDGLTPEDLLDVGGATDEAEETAELSETQQDIATEGTGGGNIAGVSGRYRHVALSGNNTFGTDDGNSLLDIVFDDGSVVGGLFNVQLASFLTIPGLQVGTFSFGPGGTDSPFGPIFGTGFVNAAQDFGFAEFEESNFPGHTVVAWAGVPTQPSAFPTTRQVTFYDLQDDFVLNSNFPFIRSGGDIGDNGPTEGAIL